MTYRCVKSNTSDDVIAIGRDEGQGGADYHGIGTWCLFTFEEIPVISEELVEISKEGKCCLKIVDDSIVLKTLEEVQ